MRRAECTGGESAHAPAGGRARTARRTSHRPGQPRCRSSPGARLCRSCRSTASGWLAPSIPFGQAAAAHGGQGWARCVMRCAAVKTEGVRTHSKQTWQIVSSSSSSVAAPAGSTIGQPHSRPSACDAASRVGSDSERASVRRGAWARPLMTQALLISSV